MTVYDQDGQRFVLFNSVIDSRTDGTHIKEGDYFIHIYNGKKRRREITKGWEVCIQLKDGSSTWKKVNDVKESFLVKLAEYTVLNQIADEPAFAWWIKKVPKKIDRIISKTAIKYWQKTHKYGLRIQHMFKEHIEIYKENGYKLWWDTILQ